VFLALRWTTLKKVFGVDAVRRWFYLATKHSHIRVDVDEPSCPCTVLLPVDIRLECRALGPRLFLFRACSVTPNYYWIEVDWAEINLI
jgi:hypothetical protein